MNIEKLKEIANTYDFVVAETSEEKERYESMGYESVVFDVENLLPELFVAEETRQTI